MTKIVLCHFPFILVVILHAVDTDLEDDWSKFSTIHILVQKENSISVPER